MNILLTVVSNVFLLLLGLASSVITARALGPAGKGALALAILVAGVLIMLGIPGLGQATVYHVGRERRESERIPSAAITLGLGLGGILAGISLLVAEPVLRGLGYRVDPQVLWLAILAIPFSVGTRVLLRVLQGFQRIGLYNAVGLAARSVEVLLILLAALLFPASVHTFLAAYLLAHIGNLFLAWFLTRRIARVSLRVDWKTWGRLLRFGVQGHLGNLLYFLAFRLDYFLVAYFLGPAGVGIYSVSAALAQMLWMVPDAVGTVLLPRTAGSEPSVSAKESARLARHTLFVTLLGAFLLMLVSRPLILGLYGQTFLPSVLPLVTLLPGVVLFGLVRIFSNHFIGLGRPLWSSLLMGVSSVLTVAGDVVLIPRLGVEGAALSASLSYMITALVALLLYRSVSGISVRETILLKARDLADYRALTRTIKSAIEPAR